MANNTRRVYQSCTRRQVRGIPSLVIFDGATGELLTSTARADVSRPGAMGNAIAVVDSW